LLTVVFPQTVIYFYCGQGDGLLAAVGVGSGEVTFAIPYELSSFGGSCPSSFGWINNETVYIIPKYPLSIGINEPPETINVQLGRARTLTAFSYAGKSDISHAIEWFINGEQVGDGPTVLVDSSVVSNRSYRATGRNAQGQYRQDSRMVRIYDLRISSFGVSPNGGDEGGGTEVEITGDAFTETTEIYFDGVIADDITLISFFKLTCKTPPGSGTVDVKAVDGPLEFTLVDGFTYFKEITVTDITPDNGPEAGGTAVTITGTRFHSGCDVVFFRFVPFYLEFATNVIIVSDTEITCDTPAGTGVVTVAVIDEDDTGGILPDGYTFT
jgi:hypothetical protein